MYAVARGRVCGIFLTWKECSSSVRGFPGALYKKFDSKEDAEGFLQASDGCIETLDKPDYYVYTDGSCRHNGQANARSGIGIFFGVGDPRNLSRAIEGTNNVAELTAILETYVRIKPDLDMGKKIVIATDSEYAIKCVSTYGYSCAKQGWNVDIPNKELVQQVYQLYLDSGVRFMHVKAHTKKGDVHSIGNAYADQLATSATE